jgi:N-dimethylarginine dimethylaminohydrolase
MRMPLPARATSDDGRGMSTEERFEVRGECQCRPHAVLVHDPVAAGAFQSFDSVAEDRRLEPELLFRSRPDKPLYTEQHKALVRTIAAQIDRAIYLHELVGDDPSFDLACGNPNQVFTRDSLITLPWAPDAYFRARLKPAQRRQESNVLETAVRRLGLHEILRLPETVFLEGGDVIPYVNQGRRCLLAGHGPRSTPAAIDVLQQELLPRYADQIIAIHLAPWRMNLDGGFLPVADDVIVADTSSILGAELIEPERRVRLDLWRMLADLGVTVIDTTPEESIYLQSCNFLCLGDRRVIGYDLCPRVTALIEQHDIRVYPVAGSELIKGRGGPRCMTRPIYLPLD